MLVKEKNFRGAFGTISPSNFLRFIPQIDEVKAFVTGTFFHFGEAIIRVFFLVVGIDSNNLHAFVIMVGLNVYNAVFPRLHIGAVVATEYQHDRGVIGVFGECVVPSVNTR